MFNKEVFKVRTGNGDLQFDSTGSKLVDFFLFVQAYPYKTRGNHMNCKLFWESLYSDYDMTIRAILKARDVRKGSKLKRVFPDFVEALMDETKIDKESANFMIKCFLAKMPELGYWKDVVRFAADQTNPYFYDARKFAVSLINEAVFNTEHQELAFKFLPIKFKKGAAFIARGCGFTDEESWRQFVAPQRNTVEKLVCSHRTAEINYSHVPTQAMKLHRNTFLKFDTARFQAYLGDLVRKVEAGESVAGQIKSAGNLPPEIIARLRRAMGGEYGLSSRRGLAAALGAKKEDLPSIEVTPEMAIDIAQWNAFERIDTKGERLLALVDSSGSMYSGLTGSFQPLDVAISVGLIASESNVDAFKDCYLSFESKARFVDLKGINGVHNKVAKIMENSYAGSTNLMSAFDMILDVAVQAGLSQEDLPTRLVIPSDMNFNGSFGMGCGLSVFEEAKAKFAAAGYKLPLVVYWYCCDKASKPTTAFEGNVLMVSGFSEQTFNLVCSGQNNVLEAILADLSDSRYDWKIEDIVPQ